MSMTMIRLIKSTEEILPKEFPLKCLKIIMLMMIWGKGLWGSGGGTATCFIVIG